MSVVVRPFRLAYVALVPVKWSVHTKVVAQQRAFEQLMQAGRLSHFVAMEASEDGAGADLYTFGDCTVRMRHRNRFDALINYLCTYGQLYRMIEREVTRNEIDTLYLRKPGVFDLRCIYFLRRLKRAHVQILFEIPTYPYSAELRGKRLIGLGDRIAQKCLRGVADRIVTFSMDSSIFDVPCVRIQNGVDFGQIALTSRLRRMEGIRLTCVSALEPWHCLDRLVEALNSYWLQGGDDIAELCIVGEGREGERLRRLAGSFEATMGRVRFCGALYGKELDGILDETDLAVGNLELRSSRNLTSVQPLKHREYAARGIPFIYGLSDPYFDTQEYCMRLQESHIDLVGVVDWYRSLTWSAEQIRADAGRFAWELQLGEALDALAIDGQRDVVHGRRAASKRAYSHRG